MSQLLEAGSGTGTTPTLGSIVQKAGNFQPRSWRAVSALKSVDCPRWARPTYPGGLPFE